MSEAAQQALNTQAMISQMGRMGFHSGDGDAPLLRSVFGTIGAPQGSFPIPPSAFGQATGSVLQLASIFRMIFTIAGGLGRKIVESIMAYIRAGSKRLAFVLGEGVRGMSQGGGIGMGGGD